MNQDVSDGEGEAADFTEDYNRQTVELVRSSGRSTVSVAAEIGWLRPSCARCGAMIRSMLIALLVGLLRRTVAVSGMADPARVRGFLDVLWICGRGFPRLRSARSSRA